MTNLIGAPSFHLPGEFFTGTVGLQVSDPLVAINEALAGAKDRYEAAVRLEQAALANQTLRDSLVARFRPNLLAEICMEAVRVEAGEVRFRARRAARSDVDRNLISRVGVIKAELQLWTLPSGIKLKEATREQVVEAITHHRSQVDAHRRAVAFYLSVAANVEPGQTVGRALDDERLAELLEKAQA